MTNAPPPDERASRLWRPAGMLFRPARTLDAIARQSTDAGSLYLGYVLPLAAIGPVCGAIGLIVFGGGIAGLHMPMNLGPTIVLEALNYLLSLVGVYALALAVCALGPLFGARWGLLPALRLVAYSCTAVWLAGVFALYPALGLPMMILGGLYSLYALYLGLDRVLGAPSERRLTYFAAVLTAASAIGVLLRLLRGRIA
jgi:hypothetical protein